MVKAGECYLLFYSRTQYHFVALTCELRVMSKDPLSVPLVRRVPQSNQADERWSLPLG
jgi:hypothetical protein